MTQSTVVRVRVIVEGTVQGVGFRPFAFRLAQQLGLGGWVSNTAHGALLELEGSHSVIDTFLSRLQTEAPAVARVERLTKALLVPEGETSFQIRPSNIAGARCLVVPPDLATCVDCLREMNDPIDRRFRYPFLTCTHCGPRFSIITDIPYDRSTTTMRKFSLCAACEVEYNNQADRRFHAEPIACPACGPQVALWDKQGHTMAAREEAIRQACTVIRNGGILAVKGLGGFQLWVDARSESEVQRLRDRKLRPHKPFAVLFPSVDAVRDCCLVSPQAIEVLCSPEAPIVLLRRRHESVLAEAVSPGNPYVGAMVPYSPLHHLLMAELQSPVVATSGNRSDEPIVIDEQEACGRLNGIADVFLVHNRPIARPVDDSVVLVVDGMPSVLRRARGYVPHSTTFNMNLSQDRAVSPILAVGGHLKNTVALTSGDHVVLSQHLGDLSTPEAYAAFRQAVDDLQCLLAVKPQRIAHDLHPDYRSTMFAQELARALSIPLVPVQHHHAHVASCIAEHGLNGEVLGVAWDGVGYGVDGTAWGGEFLVAGYEGFTRMAHLLPFKLPGGDRAMREPRRAALSVIWEVFGDGGINRNFLHRQSLGWEYEALTSILRKGIAAPMTTSMGRLFDAVASLMDLHQVVSFEGQAAMALEFMAERASDSGMSAETRYAIPLIHQLDHRNENAHERDAWIADWRPMIQTLVNDLQEGMDRSTVAHGFHQSLADLIGHVAEIVALPQVVLTGGVFQNALLTRLARRRLEQMGFAVYTHSQIPPNDGGLALGQAMVAAHR